MPPTVFPPEETLRAGCDRCRQDLGFSFSFAFQPIVDVERREVFGYEALVRGPGGEPAMTVLGRVDDANRYAFDQACRVHAITLASRLGLDRHLSINFLPNAVYEPSLCIRSTLEAAQKCGFPAEKILFEVTEAERIDEVEHLTNIFAYYRSRGFLTALDDFGAGHSGLNMLARFVPDLIKIDMALVRDVHRDRIKQAILEGLLLTCRELGVKVLAEGVEQAEEADWFAARGVALMQGFFFAKPGFECLPPVRW